MAIPEALRANFNTMMRAARNGDLALIEGKDAKTGETRYIIAAIGRDGEEYTMTPFGHLSSGNPFEDYADPTLEA